ncbi:alpha/beta hydrolase [Mycobacterium sp.]|uniref:alpha/beta hydrolase n=1 Tax=Mycobacterium sp. TaxID=1785 RepID=UPI003A88C0E0
MSRRITLPAILLVAATMSTACAPLFGADPRFATNSGARPQGAAPKTTPPGGPAPIAAPKNDLSWHDCTTTVNAGAGVEAMPGVTLDCATFDSDLDALNGGSRPLIIGAVRARSDQTPDDAGPLVFTTGSDIASSAQLPVWLSRAGADVLKSHPIVAIDRRGMGMSSPIDCRDRLDRDEMRDQTQFEVGDDPVANLSAVSNTATTDCTDTIAPGASAYDNTHAASDIERLRNLWDVPAVALIGIGNGAQVALTYAGSRPDKVARLILDSPAALGASAETAAEQRVKGQQAALDAFAAQCVAVNCALGPDPKAAVSELLASARGSRGLGGVSVASITNAITTQLGYPGGDRVRNTTELADAVAAARSGDMKPLNTLIDHAQAIRDSDGQFVGSCSDAVTRPTPDRVRELVVAWAKLYPEFGAVAALDLVECVHWPTGPDPTQPKKLTVDVLLLGVQNDPIVGNEGVAATAATVINATAAGKRVMWQGIGHGASIYSPCAVPPLIAYLDGGQLPGTDTYCPA